MKHLEDLDDIAYWAVTFLGLWGATMNFAKRKIKGYSLLKKIFLFIFDNITSGGISIITYLLVYGYWHDEILAVGFSGVFAYQGTRAFYVLEQIISQKLGVKL